MGTLSTVLDELRTIINKSVIERKTLEQIADKLENYPNLLSFSNVDYMI